MTRRIQKVKELLKQETAKMILETVPEEMGLITVVEVDLTDDLKNAKIYISCFNRENSKKVLKLLDARKFSYQHELGRKLEMRYTPKLEYILDESVDQINKVEELLDKIDKKE